ncbi:DoxX-like family protein [Pseudomonas sp. KU26590]|uniref:DoxX-like family protein n=1 Tax=Pseudomonas sp. KU26590 TaxID=2991051 RepID=UPI002AC834C1|nr:DoxX-like family protein [Pseudomonas sp. KU26590]
MVQAAGVAELVLAAVLLLLPRLHWPLPLTGLILLALLVDVAIMQPSMLLDAFNPVTLNVAGMALCAIAWTTRPRDQSTWGEVRNSAEH